MKSDKKLIGYNVSSDFLIAEFPAYHPLYHNDYEEITYKSVLDIGGKLQKVTQYIEKNQQGTIEYIRESTGEIKGDIFYMNKNGIYGDTVRSDINLVSLTDELKKGGGSYRKIKCNETFNIIYSSYFEDVNPLPMVISVSEFDKLGRCISQIYMCDREIDFLIYYYKYTYYTDELIWKKREASFLGLAYDYETIENDFNEKKFLVFPEDFYEKAEKITQNRKVTPIYEN